MRSYLTANGIGAVFYHPYSSPSARSFLASRIAFDEVIPIPTGQKSGSSIKEFISQFLIWLSEGIL